ncbi:MAG: acyltransferase [Clostridia bacterium]|nr:acyltransferase [Clostridia bacterium]
MERESGFDLNEISQARSHLLGLATLWVALFHSYHLRFLDSPLLSQLRLAGVLNRLRELGNCGVDVFLFLSGLGLYYSMTSLREAQTQHPIRRFYARRFARILPPVLIVSILYYGLSGTASLSEWLGKVFLIGSFSQAQAELGYWYFALLSVLYLLYPLIDLIQRKGGAAGIVGAILLSLILTFAASRLFPVWFARAEIMLTRIPVFLLGVQFAPWCRNHKRIPRWIPWLGVPLLVGGLFLIPMIPSGASELRRYAYAGLTLALVLTAGLLCSLLKRKGFLWKCVCAVGTCSLEIYLLYENLYVMDPPLFRSVDPAGIVYALTVFAAALVLSVLLRLVVRTLREGFRPSSRNGV